MLLRGVSFVLQLQLQQGRNICYNRNNFVFRNHYQHHHHYHHHCSSRTGSSNSSSSSSSVTTSRQLLLIQQQQQLPLCYTTRTGERQRQYYYYYRKYSSSIRKTSSSSYNNRYFSYRKKVESRWNQPTTTSSSSSSSSIKHLPPQPPPHPHHDTTTTQTQLSDTLLQYIQHDKSRLIGCNIYITIGGDIIRHPSIVMNVITRTQQLLQEKSTINSTISSTSTSSSNSTICYNNNSIDNNVDTTNIDLYSNTNNNNNNINDDSSNNPNPNSNTTNQIGILAYTYTDIVYNRTSFHYIGTPEILYTVITDMLLYIYHEIQQLQQQNTTTTTDYNYQPEFPHPHVGIIDHIAVVPLVSNIEATALKNRLYTLSTFHPNYIKTHAANVARQIGTVLRDQCNINIFYYGLAQKSNISLFKVRKRVTNFFTSNGRITTGTAGTNSDEMTYECCTIGAPINYVENYNIRFKSNIVTKKTAQYISRILREKDGGIIGVEALALPYSNNRWEVGCNILQPYAVDIDNINNNTTTNSKATVQQQPITTIQQIQDVCTSWDEKRNLIETMYRIGLTQLEAIQLLETIVLDVVTPTRTTPTDDNNQNSNNNASIVLHQNRKRHDEKVIQQQLQYFNKND